jgi:hypothetical protein
MNVVNVFDYICSISVDGFPICWQNLLLVCMISGFCRKVDENCNFLDSRPLKMGPIGCPSTSVSNYLLHNNPEECSSLAVSQNSSSFNIKTIKGFHFPL